MSKSLTLRDGSRIAIIGGGPAGAFFAHFAYKYAEEIGIHITVTIFDGKDFLKNGPKGCNLCAGVIAESLNTKLKDEGIFLPEKRIINDNHYGRLLFKVNDIISAVPILTHSHFTIAEKKDSSAAKKVRSILWNMFTGNIPYKDIFKISLNLRLQLSLLWTTMCLSLKRLLKR